MYGQYLAQVQVEAVRRSGFTGPNVESEVLFLQLNIRDIGKGKTHEWNLEKKEKKQPNVSQS